MRFGRLVRVTLGVRRIVREVFVSFFCFARGVFILIVWFALVVGVVSEILAWEVFVIFRNLMCLLIILPGDDCPILSWNTKISDLTKKLLNKPDVFLLSCRKSASKGFNEMKTYFMKLN